MFRCPPGTARWALCLAALSAFQLCGCGADATRDPFTASGQLIALSGGGGGAAANACFTCHGLRGQGDGQSVPRLAGLQGGYLQKQLEDYAAGRRADEVMGPVARGLGADDRHAVAAYYAGSPAPASDRAGARASIGTAADLYHRGDPARALAPCAACHGEAGEGVGAANPAVAGQPEAYVADQLTRWKAGRRRNDPRGVMLRVSERLTASEIAALSAYVSRLSGSPAPAGLSTAASR